MKATVVFHSVLQVEGFEASIVHHRVVVVVVVAGTLM